MSLRRDRNGGWLALAAAAACACVARSSGADECPAPSFGGPAHSIVEAGRFEESADPCWWLSSGGRFEVRHGVGRTIQGDLPAGSEWHDRYTESNPADTDAGLHPQNLLRLVTRARWEDYRQRVRFRIRKVNLSASRERGEWSGVLLFLRYQDSENLYYAGLRMDGTAVIKKKLAGTYYTLAQEPVFGDARDYDRAARPSLLPLGKWVELASSVSTQADGAVRVAVLTREGRAGAWRTVAEAVDGGEQGAPILASGHGGVRADFMDIEFSGYAVEPETPERTAGAGAPR